MLAISFPYPLEIYLYVKEDRGMLPYFHFSQVHVCDAMFLVVVLLVTDSSGSPIPSAFLV